MRGVAKAILVAIGLLSAGPVLAADLPTKKPALAPIPEPVLPSTWHFEITVYGWASSIAGSTGFGSLPTLPYYASFGKVLEHFQGAFMGSVVARNDTFIGGLDFVGARIGGSAILQNPDNVLYGGKTDLTLNEAFITAFGGVRVPLGVPNLYLYGTVGARNFYAGTKLTVSGPFGLFNGAETVNKDWVMPVAGFAAQYKYDDRRFINVLADLGGWSDSATGQALASIGYNWTQNFSTTLGYRVMYTYTHQDTGFSDLTFEPRSFRYQQWMYGPFVGFKYSFRNSAAGSRAAWLSRFERSWCTARRRGSNHSLGRLRLSPLPTTPVVLCAQERTLTKGLMNAPIGSVVAVLGRSDGRKDTMYEAICATLRSLQ